MYRKEFEQIIFDTLRKVSPDLVTRLHASVDASKLWDGKVDTTNIRVTKGGWGQGAVVSEYHIMLSFGCIKIKYGANEDDEVQNLILSYHIPEVCRWFQPLYKNSIERGTWDESNFDEHKLAKYFQKRLTSLLDAVEKWYADSILNIEVFKAKTATGPSPRNDHDTMLTMLMETAGRVRVCAETHKQRCNALGITSHADRISKLCNLLSDEIRMQLEDTSAFTDVRFMEG